MATVSKPETQAVADDIAAHLQKVCEIGRERDRLTEQKHFAEDAYVQLIRRAYDAGALAMDDLAAAYYDYREVADTGYSYRWDLAIPISSVKITGYAKSRPHRQPNGPDGSWHGRYPFADGPTPGLGTPVVYLLFDEAETLCYIGSSQTFRTRLNSHSKDGKQFCRWEAYPCTSRRSAFDREYELIYEHQPYLNKAGRL